MIEIQAVACKLGSRYERIVHLVVSSGGERGLVVVTPEGTTYITGRPICSIVDIWAVACEICPRNEKYFES